LCGAVLALFQASAAVVINEIHYNPDVKTEPAEFVELHNPGTIAVNLAGWHFSEGLNYTFPSVNLPAGGFVVVAQNPAFLQTKFGTAGVLGPFNTNGSSGLSSRGEKLTLRNAAGQVQDEVEYQLGFPWPTVGDATTPGNGNSIELIHPALDNDLGGSWRSSLRVGGANGPTPGRTNTVFATNAPPQIRQVEHSPNEPTSGQSVKITAKVTDPHGVASVTLQYQIVSPGAYIELTDAAYNNAANWITLAMNDAGTNGDTDAGDETYTTLIPASVQTHRRLIRYRITVADTLGSSVRVPYADDPQPNFAYFVYDGVPGWRGAVQPGAVGANGTVINYSSNVLSRLPVYHLIARSNTAATATWFSRYTGDLYQWAGTLVYDGKVYDHVHYRARGGVWRYSMVKNMWKFDMNRGHDFEPRDNWGRKFKTPWTKLNLGASIQQGDFNHRGEQGMFESVGFRLFQLAGVPAPNTTFCTFRIVDDAEEASPLSQFEGDFWGAYLAIEQEDGRFLEEHGLPDGNLYKMEGGTGELNNTGPNGPINKSDLTYLQANYTGASEQWWRTNWNLPSHYSYQAIVQAIHHYDIADGKNYFFYRNPETRLWESCTWDLDLTWADNMYRAGQTGGGEPLKSRLLDDFNNPGRLPNINIEFRNRVREIRDLLWNSDQAFKLIDEYAALLRGPTNGPTILDADRSMWDYNPKMLSSIYSENPASKAGQGRFYQWPNEPTVSKNFDGGLQVLKNYVGYRSTNAVFSLDTIAADNAKPNRPTIAYTGPTGFPINRLTFRSTNYSGTNPFRSLRWRIAEITDTNSPNFRPDEPHKYEIETVWESGPITSFNADITVPANVLRAGSRYRVRVLHTDTTGRNSQWSLPQEFTIGPPENQADLLNYLRITEFMFNPPASGYEYVELYNSSSTVTLDLSGVKFTQGIDYTFLQGTTLLPGSYLVLAGTTNIAAFRAYYGLDGSVAVIGAFSGALNNAGEQVVLRTSAGGTDIVNFSYGDGRGWPPQADGTGHTLVLLDSALGAQGAGAGEYAGNWRASTYLRGTPGAPDAVLPPTILINEVVAHTDFTIEQDSNDWIELYNATDSAITLGSGWFLSDDSSGTNLMKWAIPSNTVIAAHGFVSFDEVTGFHNPTNTGFGLNKAGEQVFLSYLPGNAQDRVVDAVSFKGQENDWSLGRYPDGGPFWYALTPRTRDTTNATPSARVVISEVMFHPPDVLVGTNLTDNSIDEFIEIHNATPGPVTLDNTNGTWRFNGGVDFTFPTNTTLPADGYLLVVNFNPATNAAQLAAFKTTYGITDPALLILGPYAGKLANNSDRLALEKPQHPDGANDPVSWVIVDEVLYADQAPWPCGSDGSGNSLQRLIDLSHGSDPAAWTAEPPTAGRVRADLPPGLPAITAQPQDRVVATNGNVSFSVSVCGTPPFTYQWQFKGDDIADATNATLVLFNVTPASAGLYSVTVRNAAGSTPSDTALLIVQFPPVITAQPQPATAIRDQGTNFSVTVGGTAPFGYQWRFNGADLPGKTNSVLTLSNIQSNQAGPYSVRVFNTAGTVVSSDAILTVLIPATIIQPPTNQTQRVTINTNGFFYNPTNVTMSVGAVGTGPLRYQWRFNDLDLADATSASLVISNVTPANEGPYTVVVTDDIGSAISPPAILTVQAPPVVIMNPVAVTNLQWQTATFSVIATGAPAPSYRWLRNGVNYLSNAPPTLVITNLQPAMAGLFRVAIANVAGTVNGATVGLGVIPDADADALPDFWELNYFGNSTNAIATADLDGDRMINRDEYAAGTDPIDPSSVLKIVLTATNSGLFQFVAQTNIGYTVQYRTNLESAVWINVTNITSTSLMRTVEVNAPVPPPDSKRFYRVVTPPVP
jgi:hypothetical protein